jgi:cobalamin synthase
MNPGFLGIDAKFETMAKRLFPYPVVATLLGFIVGLGAFVMKTLSGTILVCAASIL